MSACEAARAGGVPSGQARAAAQRWSVEGEMANNGTMQARYAVVTGGRRRRTRVSAACVRLYEDAETARRASDADTGCYAAKVLGPSPSAEGQLMYYLLEWLD